MRASAGRAPTRVFDRSHQRTPETHHSRRSAWPASPTGPRPSRRPGRASGRGRRDHGRRRRGRGARAPLRPPDAVEPAEAVDEADADINDTDDDADGADLDPADHRALWEELRIDPSRSRCPPAPAYTLRAYRMSTELTPTDTSDRDDDDPFAARARDAKRKTTRQTVFTDEELARVGRGGGPRRAARSARPDEGDADEDDDADAADEDATDEDEAAAHADDEDVEEEEEEESRGGSRLPHPPWQAAALPQRRVAGELHPVRARRTTSPRSTPGRRWPTGSQPVDVAPLDEDSYELDLVVENLRGGHDTWDPALIIEAGEVARDLAYALRLPAVLDMLSPGSTASTTSTRPSVPWSTAASARFLGRRRVRKIGAQTASLGWRTIIGKISAAVDWRD